MPGQEIIFPTSTQPSTNPTENGGRLINALVEKAPPGSRSSVLYRRTPGLRPFQTVGVADFRGALLVGSILYVANGSTVYTVTPSGATYIIAALTGTLPGVGFVMMERNMNASPQILILHSAGVSKVVAGVVSDFTDPDLPSVTSLCFLDGYFIFTSVAGQAIASGINDITVSALDFATAEAAPDGLIRGIASGSNLLLMGEDTIEIWADVGNAVGFPFSRSSVIPIGLLGIRAVAGMDRTFAGDVMFVGSDKRVYRMQGYTPAPVSTPYIEALLQAVTDPTTLEASAYTVNGHPSWILTSPTWTLVFDQSTASWHERQTIGTTRWRATGCIKAFSTWLAFERDSNEVYTIDPTFKRENADQLVWEVRSTQAHRFPGAFVIGLASFDFVTGVGIDAGVSPIETDPVVSISWSDDGGRSFSNPLALPLGRQGQTVSVDIPEAGQAERWGRQWRLQVADPVEATLLGGAMDAELRAAWA